MQTAPTPQAAFVEIAPLVRRIRAANPSPLTGSGTNTYLLGKGAVTVIDPGPNDPSHLKAILDSLGPEERIVRILVTHSHLDHTGLVPALQHATGAPTFAFGDAKAGLNPNFEAFTDLGGSEGTDHAFSPDHRLTDGEIIEGEGWQIESLHTPGHLGNHLCFRFGALLFSGDHVMGWSSSVVSPPEGDMTDYIASLEKLLALPPVTLLPGHGEAVENGLERVAELLAHRRLRERQILAGLAESPATAAELTARIYSDLPPYLQPAATRNVLAHLLDLAGRSAILADPSPSKEALWKISS